MADVSDVCKKLMSDHLKYQGVRNVSFSENCAWIVNVWYLMVACICFLNER